MVRKFGQFAYRYAISTPGVQLLGDRLEGDHFLYSYPALSGCLFAALRSDCSSQEAVGPQQESQACGFRIACSRPASQIIPVKIKKPCNQSHLGDFRHQTNQKLCCVNPSWLIMRRRKHKVVTSRHRRSVEAIPIQRRALRSCFGFRSRKPLSNTPTRRPAPD
jgi:hypothetical protein